MMEIFTKRSTNFKHNLICKQSLGTQVKDCASMQHTRLRLARVLKMWKRALPAPNCHGESCSLEWCLLTSARRRRKFLGIRGRLGGAENTLKLNLETWFSHKTIPKSVKNFRLRRAKIPKFQIFNPPKNLVSVLDFPTNQVVTGRRTKPWIPSPLSY